MVCEFCICSCVTDAYRRNNHLQRLYDSDEIEEHKKKCASFDDEEFNMKNRRIKRHEEDILYHLALGNKSHDLVEMFGDVKFVCMGGTPDRMEKFAYYILQETGFKISPGTMLQDLSAKSHRYALFKIGPVMSVSHGMGMPSISILLHELIKLMYHAGVKKPLFFRLGTCGGIAVEPGTVVVSTEVLNGELKPVHKLAILGKAVERPAILDQELAEEIRQLREPSDGFEIIGGKTISTDDFYEGQGRMDGAFYNYTEEEKLAFLRQLQNLSVANIEMEALALAAITHHVGIKTAVICVTLLDRLKADQIHQSKETLSNWQERPMIVMARYIKKYLQEHSNIVNSYVIGKLNTNTQDGHTVRNIQTSQGRSSSSNSSSAVVSSMSYLKRVMDESNSIDE